MLIASDFFEKSCYTMRMLFSRFRGLWTGRVSGIVFILCFLLALYLLYSGARLVLTAYRWQATHWVPQYLLVGPSRETVPDDQKHLVFVMVDHYEHGVKPESPNGNRDWCEKFRAISDEYRDDFGNGFRYTWFYPYDHHVGEIVADLSQMAYEGYGEVEFHWHIGTRDEHDMTTENYSEKVAEAVRWFQQYGAMITEEEQPRTAFAYIAGVWDLDASRKPLSHGLTNQLEVLHENGCYADFTFSTIATAAQPRKINSLYYVKDDPKQSKSYNTGADVEVGKSVDDQLMIFQGPLSINWKAELEYGAIETDPRFHKKRIPRWLESNIHVKGRPEWVFVKVYSHGAQSQRTVLEKDMKDMLRELKAYTSSRGIKLHFMTAREAFNVAKAAEAGKTGNPEDYRDYHIPKYQNMVRSFRETEPVESSLAELELSPVQE